MSLTKYDPKLVESKVIEFWSSKNIYLKIRQKNRGKKKFYFLDGPPYPSSDVIHVGTGWNKVLKDLVIRFRRMQGYDVWDKPGYDCHGLPIEVAVEKMLGFKSKKDIEKYGRDKFVKKCRELVERNVRSMTERFKDLGVFMDWDDPYLTLRNKYIESGWWLVKKAHEKGLLKKGVKVMHWCPRCQTVLSDYEVKEYKDLEDPSIYVKFPVEGNEGEYIVVWTTTPWTLPGNVAVMVNPKFEYAKVEFKGERLIIALDRVKDVLGPIGDFKVLETFKGEKLKGLKYVYPLSEEVPLHSNLKNAHYVILSERYVRTEEGTGCVHTAPGHGEEDFEVGLEYNLPILSPINDEGVFTKEGGKYAGLYVKEANNVIIKDLKDKGLLLRHETIVHKYPVCWRCKTPLIFRATQQWFIEVSKLKDKMLKEAEKVRWIPEWAGENRLKNWLLSVKDWVISRQRYWGTPLPIWTCKRCNNQKVIGSKEELKKNMVSGDLGELHRPWIDSVVLVCDRCGGEMVRVSDVMDVWFDSGVAFYASLEYPMNRKYEEMRPVDFIVEGHDQISGWFYSLLRVGIIGFDEVPYRTVLMHGFALDEKGHEMHKSLGNFVSTDEAISLKGRDSFRLYVLSNTPWDDLRYSNKGVEEVFNDLNIAWNVFKFASTYMFLDNFRPKNIREAKLSPEDRWILSRLQEVIRDVTSALEEYKVHIAAKMLRRFIVEDVSRKYIKLIRRRVWLEGENEDKLAVYETLYKVLLDYLRLAAPLIPFFTEYWYQELFRKIDPSLPESIHMNDWPRVDEELSDPLINKLAEVAFTIVESGLLARNKAKIKIRQPLPELRIYTDSEDVKRAVRYFESSIKLLINVKSVMVYPKNSSGEVIEYRITPVYSKIGPEFKELTGKVLERLHKISPANVVRALEEKGHLSLEIDERVINIHKDHLEIKWESRHGFSVEETPYGIVALNITIGEEEKVEGIVREVVRRIQHMRKMLNLPVESFIDVEVLAKEEVIKALEKRKEYLVNEVRARELKFLTENRPRKGFIKSWKIDGEEVLIGVNKVD